MPRGRLIFDGDKVYTEKKKRIHKLTPEIETKIDAIPGVVDDANSISTTDALSARMGKVLQDQINELKSMGRFLSTWNCTTGLPTTDPADDPYYYQVGDYYIVASVGTTNYRPRGTYYVHGAASTVEETETVNVNDWYLFDGTGWVLQSQTQVTIVIDSALSTSSTNAVENRVVTTALNNKQNTISDLETIRNGATAGATAIQPGDNISELNNNSGYQTAGDVASAVATAISTLAPDGVGKGVLTLQKNGAAITGGTFSANEATNKTINIEVPTTVAELSDANTYATKTYVGDEISDAVSGLNISQYAKTSDVNTALANKQDKLSAGTGIGINGNVVSNSGVLTVNSKSGNVTVKEFAPTNEGTVGQVLVKTANGYAWATIQTGGNVVAMTQAEYNNLTAAQKADGTLRLITDAPYIRLS